MGAEAAVRVWVTAQISNGIFSRKIAPLHPAPHLLLRLLIKPLHVFLAEIQVAVSRGLARGGNTTARAPAGRA